MLDKIKSLKKLHRFFILSIPPVESFELNDLKLVHQLHNVLRYKPQEQFILFSEGSDDQVVVINSISKKNISLSKEYIIPSLPAPQKNLIVAVSLIKNDLFELVVQKLSELRVNTIVPIITSRTIKKSVRVDRIKQISQEAVEQSGGNRLVDISEPLSLEECFQAFPIPSVIFNPYSNKETDLKPFTTLAMYVGPEGGWAPEDELVFKKYSPFSKNLGPSILRTETAAIIGAYELLK